ncbi:hypothetical protein ACSU6B_23470 [Neobacillus sp. C211]|uniref:hypothetical protein n=1 Tax=unclassified Neobacillus TaxID=2675272 RepID=UPI00397C843D
MRYYLIDLERTISSRMVHYWKANKRGYSPLIEEAGLYSEEAATEIVEGDFDKRTVMVSEDTVKGILKNT